MTQRSLTIIGGQLRQLQQQQQLLAVGVLTTSLSLSVSKWNVANTNDGELRGIPLGIVSQRQRGRVYTSTTEADGENINFGHEAIF